jgi:hypothetical protein
MSQIDVPQSKTTTSRGMRLVTDRLVCRAGAESPEENAEKMSERRNHAQGAHW